MLRVLFSFSFSSLLLLAASSSYFLSFCVCMFQYKFSSGRSLMAPILLTAVWLFVLHLHAVIFLFTCSHLCNTQISGLRLSSLAAATAVVCLHISFFFIFLFVVRSMYVQKLRETITKTQENCLSLSLLWL